MGRITNCNNVISTNAYEPKQSTKVWNFRMPSTSMTKRTNQQMKNIAEYLIFRFFSFIVISFLFSNYRYYQFSCSTIVAIFTEVDSLPGSQIQMPVGDGNSQAYTTQSRLCMCWHIISTFQSMLGRFSGTRRLKMVSMSTLTSGSQFSLMLSPQLVCFVKILMIPVLGSFGNWRNISLVTRWKPLDLGVSVISTC